MESTRDSATSARAVRIRHSLLWSAAGDAAGFMGELVDIGGLTERTGQPSVRTLQPWRLRVGGRYGVVVPMPGGAWSDDTQLRLATARSIGPDGQFDVECFAKIELPVWLAYSVGAGRGTKAAAANLMRDSSPWFANFYKAERVDYFDSGGNGAAMRIQPHVYASVGVYSVERVLSDVITNAVVTHGHPRGVLGACVHALSLYSALMHGRPVGPDDWSSVLRPLDRVLDVVLADNRLSRMWLPQWEARSGGSLAEALTTHVQEIRALTAHLQRWYASEEVRPYADLLHGLGAYASERRGSATLTSMLALGLAWQYRDNPWAGLMASANALGSDTDTIATMAGAIMGCFAGRVPPELVQDQEYLDQTSHRLWSIAVAEPSVRAFPYPSLVEWRSPRSPLDICGLVAGRLALAGLGFVTIEGETIFPTNERVPSVLRWVRTEFGQSMLVKLRDMPSELLASQVPAIATSGAPTLGSASSVRRGSVHSTGSSERDVPSMGDKRREGELVGGRGPMAQATPHSRSGDERTPSLFPTRVAVGDSSSDFPAEAMPVSEKRLPPKGLAVESGRQLAGGQVALSIDEATRRVIQSGFHPETIGICMLAVIDQGDEGIERAIAFAAVVAKAHLARRKRRMPSSR